MIRLKPVMMSLRKNYFLRTSVLLIILFSVVSSNSLKQSGDSKKVVEAVEKYFPMENSLSVVLGESDKERFLPSFHVPVVFFTRDKVLQHCGMNWLDHVGYILIMYNATNIEKHIVPLLKCLNQTTLKLNTKYILLWELSKSGSPNYNESYSYFLHNLWEVYGLINIAVLSVQDHQSLDPDSLFVYSYNPFLARHDATPSALTRSTLAQNVRQVMVDRFRNMHGHALRTAFFSKPNNIITFEELYEKQNLGADPGVLLKQILEANLNVSFEAHKSANDIVSLKNGAVTEVMEEISSGKTEYCINFFLLHTPLARFKQIQMISTGFSLNVIFVVPMPRQVESWRLFQYIFQWQVCVGLGLVMILLIGAAVLFVRVHSQTSKSIHSLSGSSEVVSLMWKAVWSIPVNRTPRTHSQRLLIACSLLLSLVFLTIFSVQLFSLIKLKPKRASIKTLQDLHNSDLPIYTIYKPFSVYLNSFENTALYKLKDNFKTDKLYENLDYLDASYLKINDRALVFSNNMIELVMELPQNKEFLQYFEIVNEPLFQSLLVMYLPIGSVYFDHFNELNLRIISGGFYLKWFKETKKRDVERFSTKSNLRAPQDSLQTDDRQSLTYTDLKIAFYILYAGLTVSTLCFLKEFCCFK